MTNNFKNYEFHKKQKEVVIGFYKISYSGMFLVVCNLSFQELVMLLQIYGNISNILLTPQQLTKHYNVKIQNLIGKARARHSH